MNAAQFSHSGIPHRPDPGRKFIVAIGDAMIVFRGGAEGVFFAGLCGDTSILLSAAARQGQHITAAVLHQTESGSNCWRYGPRKVLTQGKRLSTPTLRLASTFRTSQGRTAHDSMSTGSAASSITCTEMDAKGWGTVGLLHILRVCQCISTNAS